MITDTNDYFAKGCGRCDRFDTPECSAARWSVGLAALRQICCDAGLTEVAKWGHPCYMYANRNIAIFGAFRDGFRLSFMNASLLKSPGDHLEPQGPNSPTHSVIRFTSDDGPSMMRNTIMADIEELKGYAEAGVKPVGVQREINLPEELIQALDADPELAEAFHALTPGRQNSYAFNLNSAKKPETRIARISKFRDKIIEGKGAMER